MAGRLRGEFDRLLDGYSEVARVDARFMKGPSQPVLVNEPAKTAGLIPDTRESEVRSSSQRMDKLFLNGGILRDQGIHLTVCQRFDIRGRLQRHDHGWWFFDAAAGVTGVNRRACERRGETSKENHKRGVAPQRRPGTARPDTLPRSSPWPHHGAFLRAFRGVARVRGDAGPDQRGAYRMDTL